MKNRTVLFMLILGFCRPGYMQTVATLETSAFLVHKALDRSEVRRDCILRDTKEVKKIVQQINISQPGTELGTLDSLQFNGVVEAPSQNYCLLYQETETDVQIFYIAVKKEGRYTIATKIEDSLFPVVRFSRDGNSMVVFNAFAGNFFVYTYKNGKVHQVDSFREFGLPPAPLNDMLIADDGETLAISSSGFQVVNLVTRQILYQLPTLVDASLISFSHDQSHIFMWVGTRIQDQDADYVIIDIQQQKIVELLNLPLRQYIDGVGYINQLEGFTSCDGSLVIHYLDMDTYTRFYLR